MTDIFPPSLMYVSNLEERNDKGWLHGDFQVPYLNIAEVSGAKRIEIFWAGELVSLSKGDLAENESLIAPT